MAVQARFGAWNRIGIAQCSGNREENFKFTMRSPAEDFAPLARKFQRRLLVNVGSASLVALGANFCGITSFLLGLSPENSRNLKLDVLYPISGYSRCFDTKEGFGYILCLDLDDVSEFIYPANWVGDQTVLYRATKKREMERSLDPPPLNLRSRSNANEPLVAFGPPGSSGELNVSVIVSPVAQDFSIEAFGSPEEVGEALVKTITGSGQRPEVKGTLINSSLREDSVRNAKYYELEFRVESPSFQRHNVCVCCACGGRLFTLNAQAPETAWPRLKSDFYRIAHSFSLTA